ncbi:unnamed protein product [Lactuca virosa]|uniref:Transmembrane protein n=1 Tax=Lactuca virosa TaxID=75947 RepID=A0AAU9NVZ8_9ASTR|nr:unnamed protein product [Lactuca virosa]
MDLKSCMTTVFIIFLLLAVPGFSKDKHGLGSEVYDIDYRGPETHSHRPPPNRNRPGGVRHGNLNKHPHSHLTQKRHKQGKKA